MKDFIALRFTAFIIRASIDLGPPELQSRRCSPAFGDMATLPPRDRCRVEPCSVPYPRRCAEMSLSTAHAEQPNIPPCLKRSECGGGTWLRVAADWWICDRLLPRTSAEGLTVGYLFGILVHNVLFAKEGIKESNSEWTVSYRWAKCQECATT
ncbi:hypothetical protein SRHO_G00116340 [Serrasalmus rhombeus]